MRISKNIKNIRPFRLLLYLLLGIFLLIGSVNFIFIFTTQKDHFYDHSKLPHRKVALVLGTSSLLKSGAPNPYFHNRIKAAAELYHAGIIEYIIVSGDNRTRYYNEPEKMRTELLKLDIPDSIIYLDYAGLRTLDSVVRCNEVFGQDSFIVVSQKFHNQRAIFLGKAHGLQVTGYNAKNIDKQSGFRIQLREYFARVKALIDLMVRKRPTHLGEPIPVGN